MELTDDEMGALRRILRDWQGEGFTAPPYEPAVVSLMEKAGVDPGE